MTGVTVRESVKVAGLVERVRVVRSFVGAVLGPGHPCGDDAVLLASELFANSLRHSSSGLPGETVTVTADVAAVRVEVADRSGPGVPELGLAAARWPDGDLVRTVARLTCTVDVPAGGLAGLAGGLPGELITRRLPADRRGWHVQGTGRLPRLRAR
jgi:hypothetical protein